MSRLRIPADQRRLIGAVVLSAALAQLILSSRGDVGSTSHAAPSRQSVPAPVDLGGPIQATLSAAAVRVATGSFIAVAGAADSKAERPSPVHVVRISPSGEPEEVAAPVARPDGTATMTRLGDVPCVSFESRGSPYVGCLRNGEWQELRFGVRQRLLGVSPAERCWDTICVVSIKTGRARQPGRQVLRWTENRWVPVSPDLPQLGTAIVALGASASASLDVGAPLVGVVQGPHRPRRRVLTLKSGSWSDAAVAHAGDFGPLVAGPLNSGRSIYMTASDFADEPWRFGVLRWTVGGRARQARLSRGFGNAQGEPSMVSGQLWVGWQEQRRREDSLSDAEYWVARLDPVTLRVLKRRRLWSGTTVVPFRVSVVDINGRPHALWVKPTWRNGRPTTRVDRDLTTTPVLERLDGR